MYSYDLKCNFEPTSSQTLQLVTHLVMERGDSVPYPLINDSHYLFCCSKASIVSASIPLLPYIVDTRLEQHFNQDLIHALQIVSAHKMQRCRPVTISPIYSQSVGSLMYPKP